MTHDEQADGGFTLVELLMTVVMTAIIVGAIGAALTPALRNEPAARDRIGDTVDTQLLSTYLPGDIQNAGAGASDVSKAPGETAGCTGLSGTNVLALRWTDAEALASYGVTYRTQAVGSEQRLLRFACGGATPGAAVIARGLAPVGGASADLTDNPRIVFTLTSAKGYASKLSVMRRTFAGGSVAPPPFPCLVDVATLDPPQGRNASGTLVPAVTLTVKASGGCGTLRATYQPDGTTSRVTTLGTGPGTTVTTLGPSGWTSGNRPLTISSGGAFVADVPFTVVNAPCAVTNVVTSPAAGVRRSNPAPNTLVSPGTVTVTADFSDTCVQAYDLVVAADGVNPTTLAFPATGLSRSVIVPATVKWSDGPHPLSVRQGATQVATGNFPVTKQACVVGTPVLSPTTARATGVAGLDSDVTVTVPTTGVCDALSVEYAPSTTTTVLKALVPDGTFSSWTYTIGSKDHSWTRGSKRIEIVTPAGDPLSPPSFAVLQVT